FGDKRGECRIEWAGREQIDGHDVIVFDYRDTVPNRGDFTKGWLAGNGVTSTVMQGRLWVDATTAQLRRDRWELMGIHPALQDPVTFIRRESTYVESRFGILLPRHVVIEFFEHAKVGKNESPAFFRANRTACTYGDFRKFEVATEEKLEASPR